MSDTEGKESTGCAASFLWTVVLGVVIGSVLAGIYTLKRSLWSSAPVSIEEFVGIVVITVIACFVVRWLDKRRRRDPLDSTVSREKPPPSEWADCCAAAYAKMGEFERWVPERRAVGNLPVQVTQVLEDKTTNYHRVVLLMNGAIPSNVDVATLRKELDAWCHTVLSPSRFRGLGVGILLQTDSGSEPVAGSALKLVDYKAHNPATVQWVVWSCESSKTAVGVHMPIEGRTTQCFVDLCVKLKEAGSAVECHERPAEGFLRFALALNRKVPWWLHVLGP
jgi:hypothetical protein